jgi:Thiol-disulfide isomerase and thioredoxins
MLRRVAGSLAIFAAAAASPAFAQAVGGRGFGDGYEWHSLEAGLARAEEVNQPAMIVFHKSWCGACKRFGPIFAKSEEIKERAGDFVLINVHVRARRRGRSPGRPRAVTRPRAGR